MARGVIEVLVRAASIGGIPPDTISSFYYLAISETVRLLGGGASRKIFEDAIAKFTEMKAGNVLVEFCIQYCSVEVQLGEIKRGRKILEHASQFSNPKKFENFWDYWKQFEITHGDELSFKDMKRARRSVDVLYSDKHFHAVEVSQASSLEVAGEQSPVPTIGGIDLNKLKQSAIQFQQSSVDDFIPLKNFTGSKPGYVFTTRERGTGYYRE
jgi:hypothetical protein